MADPGGMARLEALKADAEFPAQVFQRLADRETLRGIAKSLGLPKGRFFEWFTTTHGDLYDAALKVVAADLALEALEFSDGQPRQVVGPDGNGLFDDQGKPMVLDPDVGRDKLRVETRLKLASKLDRARFGESVRVDRGPVTPGDAALLGFAAALLDRLPAPRVEKVIEHAPDGAALREPI